LFFYISKKMNRCNFSTSNFSKRVEGLDDIHITNPLTDRRLLVYNNTRGTYDDTTTVSSDTTMASNSTYKIPDEFAVKGYVASYHTLADEPTGFATRATSTLAFTNGSRTLSIQPTGGPNFDYYISGVKFTSTGATRVITAVLGLHYVYFDGATLTSTTTWSIAILRDYCYVAAVYWDTTGVEHIYLGDERHGLGMSWEEHYYLHVSLGTQFISGLSLSGLETEQDGSLASHCTVQTDLGQILDEDIINDIPVKVKGVDLYYIFYKTGASGDWSFTANTAPILNAPAGRVYWNEFTGGAWQLTEGGISRFILSHIFCTNDYTAIRKTIVVMGEAQYTGVVAARSGAATELNSLILANMPFEEFLAVGTLLYQTGAYANIYKARLRDTITGTEEYVDWRQKTRPSTTSLT